jgi:hypothetical protein
MQIFVFIRLSWEYGPGGFKIARGDELENRRGHTQLGRRCKAPFGGYFTRDLQRLRTGGILSKQEHIVLVTPRGEQANVALFVFAAAAPAGRRPLPYVLRGLLRRRRLGNSA